MFGFEPIATAPFATIGDENSYYVDMEDAIAVSDTYDGSVGLFLDVQDTITLLDNIDAQIAHGHPQKDRDHHRSAQVVASQQLPP